MCPSFPFGIEGGVRDEIVLIPDHCLSIYFATFFFASLLKEAGEKNYISAQLSF